jgi:hypothetical protein
MVNAINISFLQPKLPLYRGKLECLSQTATSALL